MKRIEIIKKLAVANKVEMPEVEALAWLEEGKANHWFGAPAVYEEVYDEATQTYSTVLVKEAEAFEVVITDITLELDQKRINAEAKAFLKATDYKATRHKEQLELGIATDLTAEQYKALITERQAARDRVVE